MYHDAASRYADRWRDAFEDEVRASLTPEAAILDIGSGRRPTLPATERPPGCRYVGLDVSAAELARAGHGDYDEIVVRDVTVPEPRLAERFDLAVSWQVLEHVRPLEHAVANIHSYLRPGGVLVAHLSGKFSAFAVVNQLVPRELGVALLGRLLDRDADTVFPAHYDRCYSSALERLFAEWSDVRIVPRFRGAGYFGFSERFRRLYLRYEDWAASSERANLATHYLVVARR